MARRGLARTYQENRPTVTDTLYYPNRWSYGLGGPYIGLPNGCSILVNPVPIVEWLTIRRDDVVEAIHYHGAHTGGRQTTLAQ